MSGAAASPQLQAGIGPRWPRRRKTASERRQQATRSEARRLLWACKALAMVHTHRGGGLGPFGIALHQALCGQTASAQPPTEEPGDPPGFENPQVVSPSSGLWATYTDDLNVQLKYVAPADSPEEHADVVMSSEERVVQQTQRQVPGRNFGIYGDVLTAGEEATPGVGAPAAAVQVPQVPHLQWHAPGEGRKAGEKAPGKGVPQVPQFLLQPPRGGKAGTGRVDLPDGGPKGIGAFWGFAGYSSCRGTQGGAGAGRGAFQTETYEDAFPAIQSWYTENWQWTPD